MAVMSRGNILGIFFLVAALSVVSVRGQVSCRASLTCAGGPGDELALVADGEACCLGNPDALAYTAPGSEECIACVVVGFINASFSGVEQGPGHPVPVGYKKGAAVANQNLVFDVISTSGTAREGSQFDYTVNTARARALASGATSNVVLTFRVDSVAQEPNETFNLTLRPLVAPTQREGLFLQDTIQVTIVDSDSVVFSFTEDDFRANEPDAADPSTFLPVLVTKSAQIASRVELVVVPLTVQEARASSLPLPPNIPEDDIRSPPFANSSDFNNANITLVFEPDEDEEVLEKGTPIFVTDDVINEATEQVFVVELILVSSLDPNTVDLSRPSALCRIIDNDPIRIGFELPGYTYEEPPFDEFIDEFFPVPPGRPESGPIFLVKEGGVVSEQTFLVSIQVTDSAPSGTNIQTATFTLDYVFGAGDRTSLTEFFFPFQQRIPFRFFLFPDELPEGTEAFQLSASPEDSREGERFPTSLTPEVLASEVFVTILDNDPIIIGFTNTSYTVDEGIGNQQVDVRVLNVPDNQPLPASVELVIQTVSGSAIGGSDYAEISALQELLIFDNNNRQRSFDVFILDDSLLEFDVEDFTLELRFDPFALQVPSNVILRPNVSTIDILDDDTVVIGFLDPPYTVGENDRLANILIGVIQGSLERSVVIQFSTNAISAANGSDYSDIIGRQFTFDSTVRVETVRVPLIDDTTFELTEQFGASLVFPGAPPSRVTLEPDTANVTILDDDVLTFGFEPDVYSESESIGSIDLGISIDGDAGEFIPHLIASTSDGTATGSDSGGEADYTSIVDQTIFFTSTNNIQLPVQILPDDLTEFSENFTAVLSSVFLARTARGVAIELTDQERNRLIINPDTATVDILDDDEAVIGFVNTDLSISEDGGELEFEIAVLQGTLRFDVLVNFITASGTALAGSDYETTSTSLTFNDQSRQSVFVPIINDTLFEDSENFFGRLSAVLPPNVRLGPDQATATILDDEGIVIGFDPVSYSVRENGDSVLLRVRLIEGFISPGRSIPVRLTTADGSAQEPSDYAAVSQVLTFSSSVTTQDQSVDIVNDGLFEIDETFTASLALVDPVADARVQLLPDSADITILDDDVLTFNFRQPMYMFMEDVGTGTVCVDKIGETDRTITVTVRGATQSGAFEEMLEFAPDVNASCIDFTVIDDDIALEDPEEFIWTLLPPPSVPRIEITRNTTTVVIIDDDILTLNLVKAQNIPEAIGTAQACVAFSNPFARSFDIFPNVGTPPNSSAMAIATPGIDYGATISPITANPGSSQACFNIEIDNDLLVEEREECLMASFTAESLANLEIGTSSSVCCIVDDDTVTIGFDPDVYFVNEDAGSVSLTVRVLAGQLARTVSVDFFTQDGTATSTAPADFVSVRPAIPITLQFSPSDLDLEARVTIIDDDITENPERFSGLLASIDPAVILAPINASVEIRDNDRVTIGFVPAQYSVNEADGSVTLMVRLISGVLEREVVVGFQTTPGSATSSAPADYEATVRQLTFSPSVNVNPVPVNIINDVIHEDNETFFGNLAAAGQPVDLNPDTAVVTIIDDIDPIVIGFERTEYNVTEGGQTEVCAVLTSGTLEKEVLVSVDSSDGTANVGADYNAVSETLTFDENTSRACFFTSALDDDLFEDDEDYRLTLTSDEPGLTLNPDEATVTIPNTDRIIIGLTNTTFSVTEEEGAFVEVCARVFEGELERNAVVTLRTMDGTALSQGPEPDYESLSVQLVFTPSMTEICQNVAIANDEFYEDPEDLTVRLTTEDEDVDLVPDTGTITILDDEQIIIGFVETSYVVTESGGPQEVCAEVKSGELRTTVAVQFSTADGDAIAPDDYTATSATFTFSGMQNEDCVNVPIISDSIVEGTEMFSGNLATTAPRVTLDPDVTQITITDEGDVLQIGFIDAPYSTREASGFVTVSVGVINPELVLAEDFVVTLTTNDIAGIQNAARAGVDYRALTTPLTFSSTVKRIDLNVTILDDSIVELTEVFEGQLTAVTVGPNVVLNPRRARISILDDPEDRVRIGLTETVIRVSEDVGMRQVCAQVFDGDLERNVEVTLNLNPLTATAGDDFVMESFMLVFGENIRGPICNNVTIVNDNIYEFDEELTFTLSTTDTAVDLDPESGTMTISDEDAVVIGWQQESYLFVESAMQARICAAIISGTLAVTLPALGIELRDGTASRGTLTITQDYIPTPNPNEFTFSSTDSDPMCTTVPIVSDNLLEPTIEDFFADLAFAAGSEPDRVTISPVVTRVDIMDDDSITIGFLDTTYNVGEGDGNAQLMIGVISGDLETNIVVNISTADNTAISTAPVDYTSVLDRSLTFSTRLPPMTVLVPINDDLIDEEDIERFTASLVLVTDNPRVQIAPQEAEVLILDNDVVTIGFERTMYNTPENNSVSVTVCASVQPPPSLAKSVVVRLTSADGTAMAPGDYDAVSESLTFGPDTPRQCVDFIGKEDDIVEANENFTVTLTSDDDINLDPDVAVVTIVEGIVINVGFVEQMYTFVENQGRVRIQVRKDVASDERFTVRVRGGPSTSSPIRRSAPILVEDVTFDAGPAASNVMDVFFDLTDDLVALEATESFVATLEILGTPSSRIEIRDFPTTTISVLDDDRVTVGFGSEGVSVQESSGEFRMCVVRDREALQDITVTISAEDETAISDLDYVPSGIQTTVTIAASDPDMRSCFTGPIIDDLIALEPDESFLLKIDSISPDNPRIGTGIETTRITIIDDDVVRVRFEQPDYLFREESGLATVCLVKDLATAVPFEVNSTTTENTANDPLDYIGGTFDVTFGTNAGDRQCINIILVSDNDRESREDFFVDVDLDDMGQIRAGNPPRTVVGIEDTGIPANDTVIGDPLMTVPILVQDSVLQMLNATRLSLCYEIHGQADAFFNLVTDECATVNAHYHDLTSYLNVIDQIGVRAVDTNGMCRNIQVDVTGCAASIDGSPLAAGARFSSGGISVRSYSNRVRISVPNCAELTLVMWVICETRTLEDPFGNGVVTGDMIKFVVMRGLNFGHRKAHGLLGQFWNIPVSVEPFKGLDRNGNPVPERYVVNITSSLSGEGRSYTGWLYDLTWSFEEGPCLYVGNRQAGPIYEVKDPNDPIIEGRYSEYLVQDLFSEEEFKYTLFNEDNCLASPIIPTAGSN